jgi:hypothetical protein
VIIILQLEEREFTSLSVNTQEISGTGKGEV